MSAALWAAGAGSESSHPKEGSAGSWIPSGRSIASSSCCRGRWGRLVPCPRCWVRCFKWILWSSKPGWKVESVKGRWIVALAFPFCCSCSLPPASPARWDSFAPNVVFCPYGRTGQHQGEGAGLEVDFAASDIQTQAVWPAGVTWGSVCSTERLAPRRGGGMRLPLALGLPPATAQMAATSSTPRLV